jgi:hypothetical protein
LIVDYLETDSQRFKISPMGDKANEQVVIRACSYGVKLVGTTGNIVDEQRQSQNLRIITGIELGQ